MKLKIEIKHWVTGAVLFEYECEDNTIKKTVEEAIKQSANLRSADLSSANLRYANLRSADLRYADLSYADLRYADLSYADLSYADLSSADLRSADLRSIDWDKLPQDWINQCSRDILFILGCLKSEVPYLREQLLAGNVDGSQYEGDCACLVGTLGKKDGVDRACEIIPFYEKGTHNPGEQFFITIKKGDTPDNSAFAKHALTLIDMVLAK